MMITLGLAGDTMLGRKVGERLAAAPVESLFSDELVDACRSVDVFLLNLECCISERGRRWPDAAKPFFFRAPPRAVDALTLLGVDCVMLANNHALDYGYDALADTFDHLEAAGIAWAGAGRTLAEARSPAILESDGRTISVFGVTDHPEDYAAAPVRAGVAYSTLASGVPRWLLDGIAHAEADVILVSPHWGPNMNPVPLGYVRAAADELVRAGATVVAGHSAHVFQGVAPPVLYDLGDFIDDYAVDPVLRNDLGALWRVTIEDAHVTAVEAIPLRLDYCRTELAEGDDARWVVERVARASESFGSDVVEDGGRVIVTAGGSRSLS